MPISGVKFGGGPEYQLPSQETLVLAKAAVMALVSSPLTMMPRFGDLEPLAAGAAAAPAGLGAMEGVVEAWTGGAALEVGATTGAALEVDATSGAAATVLEVSATAGGDEVELEPAPTPASVMAESTVDGSGAELASSGDAVTDSTGEDVRAWVGSGA